MKPLKVLVLEDQQNVRWLLKADIGKAGFEVLEAANVSEARRILETQTRELAVAVLDIRLDDRAHPEVTGLDIGLELKERALHQRLEVPGLVVHTTFTNPQYYDYAIQLGAASYLVKGKTDTTDVVRAVRREALHYLIRTGSEALSEVIRSPGSAPGFGSVGHGQGCLVCDRVLLPALDRVYGGRFALVHRAGRSQPHVGHPGDSSLSPLSDVRGGTWERLLNVCVGYREGSGSSTEIGREVIDRIAGTGPALRDHSADALMGGRAVAVEFGREDSLMIVLLPGLSGLSAQASLSTECECLRGALSGASAGALIGAAKLAAAVMNERERRIAVRETFAETALYVGAELTSMTRQALEPDADPGAVRVAMRRIEGLGETLWESGELLARLHEPSADAPVVDLSAVAGEAVRAVNGRYGKDAALSVRGDAKVNGDGVQITEAMVRLLGWFVERARTAAPAERPLVGVTLRRSEHGVEISLESPNGPRLPAEIRHRLFRPFSELGTAAHSWGPEDRTTPSTRAPLFVAAMIVEQGWGGEIIDESQGLEGDRGHRFVVRLPVG